jgi:hypothetical protein
MNEGLIAYRDGRYEEGAGLFAAAARTGTGQTLGNGASSTSIAQQATGSWFLAGLCFLHAQVADSALACLQRALSTPSAGAGDEVRWYLAQAHLLRGDAAGAAEQLSVLANGSPRYREQAADLLRAIDLRHAR